MQKIIKCPRCHEIYVRKRPSTLGICPWCESDLIELDQELSRKCGIRPLTKLDVLTLNKYWLYRNA